MLENSVLLKTFARQKTERVPVWFMRQAGRYLPEYRALRANHRMLDLIRNPELAAEVTLQPTRRFKLDAAIIFADILNPLIGMGVDLDFVEGEGPKIFNPIKTVADVEKLRIPDIQESVGYTLEALKICAAELNPKSIPVLGFAGAPFTLSCYLLEGGKLGNLHKTKKFMLNEPAAWHDLQEKIVEYITAYLVAQARAGASAVQLFDSWAGYLGESEYLEFALPYIKKIITSYKKQTSAPIMYFSTGTSGIIQHIKTIPSDGFSVDWRTDLLEARQIFGENKIIQGNLDPLVLAGPQKYLEREVLKILTKGKQIKNYIFNLGHGIVPETPPENVGMVIDLVRSN